MLIQQAISARQATASSRVRYRATGPWTQLSFANPWPMTERGVRTPRAPRLPVHRGPTPQLAFELGINDAITPLMLTVEKVLKRLAISRSPIPNNPILGTLAGGRGRSSASRALERLARVGRLRIERDPGRRRVVFPDGTMTDWGDARPGHKPYSRDPSKPAPVPKPQPTEILRLPPPPPQPPLVTRPSPSCQWPLWADDQAPTGFFCGDPSLPGRSWCRTHFHVVYAEAPELCAGGGR